MLKQLQLFSQWGAMKYLSPLLPSEQTSGLPRQWGEMQEVSAAGTQQCVSRRSGRCPQTPLSLALCRSVSSSVQPKLSMAVTDRGQLCGTGETWSWNLRLKECVIWNSFNEVKYLGVLRENADLQNLCVGNQEMINWKARMILNGTDGKGEM